MKRWGAALLAFMALWLSCTGAWARHEDPVRLGVLIHRPMSVEQRVWQPLAEALRQTLPEHPIELQLLTLTELDEAVQTRAVDFVLTNPGHYVLLSRREGLGPPLATLVRRIQGQPSTSFGGVAFVQATSPIRHWKDLRGQRVAIVSKESLGGYQMQAYAMKQHGADVLDAVQWLQTGMPQDRVVQAVLTGTASVGFVRDGVLEDMARLGQLDLDRVRILEPQSLATFPHQVSTPLYPEWPVAALPGVDPDLTRQLALSLLSLQDTPPLRTSADLAGFQLPLSYTSVEDLLRAIRMPPFGTPTLSWRETLELHWQFILLALGALIVLLGILLMLWLHRLRLRRLLEEQSFMLDELAIAAETFESNMGVIITDGRQVMQRVNQAFCEITGYTADEVLGHTPHILSSGRHDGVFYRDMMQALNEHGKWQGEIWNRRKNGEIYPEWLSISAVRDAHGTLRHYVGVFSDISWRKKAEQQIEQLAFYDPLTGLANRRLLLERVASSLSSAARRGLWGGLLFIDLDHFKDINDTLGHEAGDRVLQIISQRIRSMLREVDTAGRLGGDEFLVLIEATHPDREAAALGAKVVADKLLAAMGQPCELGHQTYNVSGSIGISLFCDSHTAAEDLLKEADLAMYQVKQSGRNNICFFDPAMETSLRQRFMLQQQLAMALERNELLLYCQPQFNANGRIVGGEILLRWRNGQGQMISPADFIPLAESSGLIIPIGDWVLRQTCATLRTWQDDPALAPMQLAVNISARQFKDPGFADHVQGICHAAGVPPHRLELELTESVFLGDIQDARDILEQLDACGFSLALDDFGTGYSSLSYLAELPFDLIKIDQSFVARLGQAERQESAIVTTIIALGHKLGMRVLAEGVETPTQHQVLRAHGCHLFQGYLLSRPMPLEAFVDLVRQENGPK